MKIELLQLLWFVLGLILGLLLGGAATAWKVQNTSRIATDALLTSKRNSERLYTLEPRDPRTFERGPYGYVTIRNPDQLDHKDGG